VTEPDAVLAQLVDRLAIEDLVVQYAKARDTTDPDLYRRIFAPDASIGLPDGLVLSDGLDQILEKVAGDQVRFNPAKRPSETSYAIMRHEVSNVAVTLTGDTARSDYYVDTLAYNETAKRPEIVACTRNEDDYVRRDGRWWIIRSTLIFGWENEEMGEALKVGPYTPPEYRRVSQSA
jgi:hypothetical protein